MLLKHQRGWNISNAQKSDSKNCFYFVTKVGQGYTFGIFLKVFPQGKHIRNTKVFGPVDQKVGHILKLITILYLFSKVGPSSRLILMSYISICIDKVKIVGKYQELLQSSTTPGQ